MQVQCPNCSSLLNVPDERAGQVVNCPKCGGQMQLPAAGGGAPAMPRTKTPGIGLGPDSAPKDKPCPYCGEPILAVAQKCRHCNTMLTGPEAGKGAANRYRARSEATGDGKKALIFGIIGLLCFGVIFGPLAIYYGNRARESDADRGMGIAGIVLGIVDLLGFLVVILAKLSRL